MTKDSGADVELTRTLSTTLDTLFLSVNTFLPLLPLLVSERQCVDGWMSPFALSRRAEMRKEEMKRNRNRIRSDVSPKEATTPTRLEGRTRMLLTDLSGRSTSECASMQTDRQNTDTADLAACHVVSAVAASVAGHT
ncbi:hypothetical protein BLNAU_10080 [Blattamonas nauphoetae]|uniref:Uncharacterized protein n=1 Tax=Blattamonas nauphoetae TaxID=2049346 RepID=A0ABQ9XTY4_9EUKA|nr:hypothetical protein BLNAU_10080 [Blattamonas nauphoetae]